MYPTNKILTIYFHHHTPETSKRKLESAEDLRAALEKKLTDAASDLAVTKAEKADQEMQFLAQINALHRQGTEKDDAHKEQISQLTSDLAAAIQAHETVLKKERSASSEAVKGAQQLLEKDREVFVLTTAAEANRCETQALRTQIADMTRQFKNSMASADEEIVALKNQLSVLEISASQSIAQLSEVEAGGSFANVHQVL